MVSRCLDSQQVQFIKTMKHGAWKFDPAQYPEAAATWRHRIRELDVASLLQTHDEVSETFLNGSHRGESVKGLTEGLISGKVRHCDITILVVVWFLAQTWVVFGNRRLKALKFFYQKHVGHIVMTDCILHDLDSKFDAPYALIAKLFDAASTRNGGEQAFFRPRKQRRYAAQASSIPLPIRSVQPVGNVISMPLHATVQAAQFKTSTPKQPKKTPGWQSQLKEFLSVPAHNVIDDFAIFEACYLGMPFPVREQFVDPLFDFVGPTTSTWKPTSEIADRFPPGCWCWSEHSNRWVWCPELQTMKVKWMLMQTWTTHWCAR